MIGMIKLLDPHPSVVCWTIFNEAWGSNTNRIESMVRIVDPTRLIDAVSGWYDQRRRLPQPAPLHPQVATPTRRDRRPFLLSEFGGYNWSCPTTSGRSGATTVTARCPTGPAMTPPCATCTENN